MHAQNKPLTEYGDLHSQHHLDVEREQAHEDAVEDSPPALTIKDGPGNLVFIGWTHGEADIPFDCAGYWNHKGKAQEAITAANNRIAAESNAAAKAADDARLQAIADQEAIDRAVEVAAEQERMQAEADAAAEVELTPGQKAAATRKAKKAAGK